MALKRLAPVDSAAPSWAKQILEPFDALDTSTPPSLSSIRDVLMEKLLDDADADLKHVVVLVLSDAVPTVDDDASWPRNVATTSLAVRLSDGDAIPKCDAALLYAPVSKSDLESAKKVQKKAIKHKIKKFKKTHSEMGPEFYIVPDDELSATFVGVPFAGQGESYVETAPSSSHATAPPTMLAVDCEMCKTTRGIELTRVSIVDETYKVVLDEYVLPANPILDYCTRYSGITRETLEDCPNTLASIQSRVLQLVPAETILVGHSLENDLLALRTIHRRVIDTSLLYPHPKGPPFRSALRHLSSKFLKVEIQTGDDGHCSVEDATCAMKLAQLKIKKGPLFPDVEWTGGGPRKLISELSGRKKSCLIVDSASACRTLAGSTAAAIPCATSDLVFHHIRHQLTTGCPPTFTWGAAVAPTNVAELLRDLCTDLPVHGLLVVVQCPSVTELKALHKLRTSRGDPRCTLLWDRTQQDKLDAAAATAQAGRVRIFAKQP
ncbi:Aste57867_25297 [Aphanomyces stellatus]|uniref:Aste57867_25297 protein n=1 Tax=Aphanomyces stellatus TaxID=120398 RepID=A0A485LTP6_9STRA|nr:hypothetical protein As57867_025219 [Aphanomyces stellatus]VFU01922.1 Aste57867_25297 [Aphanomyces stellatus]